MEIIATKKFDLVPIGDIVFVWSRTRSRRKGTQVYVPDIIHVNDIRLKITKEDEKSLHKLMKSHGSEVLTDGINLYSTFGECISQIKHPAFVNLIDLYRSQKLYDISQ